MEFGYAELVDNHQSPHDASSDGVAGLVCLQLGNHALLDSFSE